MELIGSLNCQPTASTFLLASAINVSSVDLEPVAETLGTPQFPKLVGNGATVKEIAGGLTAEHAVLNCPPYFRMRNLNRCEAVDLWLSWHCAM